jgi:hypothetical protein
MPATARPVAHGRAVRRLLVGRIASGGCWRGDAAVRRGALGLNPPGGAPAGPAHVPGLGQPAGAWYLAIRNPLRIGPLRRPQPLAVAGEERTKVLLLACCIQEGATPRSPTNSVMLAPRPFGGSTIRACVPGELNHLSGRVPLL